MLTLLLEREKSVSSEFNTKKKNNTWRKARERQTAQVERRK